METTEQRLGPWVARFEWDQSVATGGPSRIVIEPADGADPAEVDLGLSTTVLRQISPVRPRVDISPALAVVKFAAERYQPGSAEYLSALAMAYNAATDALVPNPAVLLAEATGKTVNTVRAHLKAARRRNLLTSIPHRAGGVISDGASQTLQRVIADMKTTPGAPRFNRSLSWKVLDWEPVDE